MVKDLTNLFRIGFFAFISFFKYSNTKILSLASGCNIAKQVVSLSGLLDPLM
jgi:hypothetical protein